MRLRALARRFVWSRLRECWREAFPPPPDVEARFAQRSRESRERRERAESGAGGEPARELVFVREAPPERGRAGRFVVDYLRHRSATDEEYKAFLGEWRKLTESTAELKDKMQTRLMTSDSLVVKSSIKVVDALQARMFGPVFERILRKDPSFDLELFEREAQFIFERVYSAYLAHDLAYLEKVCSGAALGHFRALITAQRELGGRPKYAHPLGLSAPLFHAVSLLDRDVPLFAFSIAFKELYCLVDAAGRVVEGDAGRLTMCEYSFWLMPHDAPDVETVGHDWAVVRVEQRQRLKQLI